MSKILGRALRYSCDVSLSLTLCSFPGYYQAGDAGYKDEDGYVHIMSRTDGMYVCGCLPALSVKVPIITSMTGTLVSPNRKTYALLAITARSVAIAF